MTTTMTRERERAVAGRGAPERVVLVDPIGCEDLAEIAELSGLPVLTTPVWPFSFGEGDRILSTAPVPAAARDRVLGVATAESPVPGVGEAWPDRTLPLPGCEEDVLAYVMDRHAPRAPVVAVHSRERGLGVSTVAACLARRLAGVPLAVALVDLTGGATALLSLGDGLRWPALADDPGPFLPGRIDRHLPVWERVRVLTGPPVTRGEVPLDAALFALAASHDIVVVDAGSDPGDVAAAAKDLLVEVRADLPAARAGDGSADICGAPGIGEAPGAGGAPGAGEAPGAVTLLRGARQSDVPGVIAFPNERGMREAGARGERPGDRTRGVSARAIRAVADLAVARL